ncbi:unnamed protein product [Protopolystoma xenopodis]|uniref:Uncharacterized protein n=1 Tax=Protopolystoma xenopodis TaxID=117903 RepID=A0A448WFG6_9PLAT|nr:unnamed protein product [Protopolystoma xenopodis]
MYTAASPNRALGSDCHTCRYQALPSRVVSLIKLMLLEQTVGVYLWSHAASQMDFYYSLTYAVVYSCVETCRSVFRLNAEGNKEEEVIQRPTTCVLPQLCQYTLQLYSPSRSAREPHGWDPIPNALYAASCKFVDLVGLFFQPLWADRVYSS